MECLYLKVFHAEDNFVVAPVESAVCLVALRSLRDVTPVKTSVSLVICGDRGEGASGVRLQISGVDFHSVDEDSLPPMASFCQLPVITLSDGISCIAGLCAVLRQVIKSSGEVRLLGFREACLVATAEFSIWTKFCEVDLVERTRSILSEHCPDRQTLPEELVRLEVHLEEPIREHNIGKLKSTDHIYAEGTSFLLSDIIISVPVHIILKTIQCSNYITLLPLTLKWLKKIKSEIGLCEALEMIDFQPANESSIEYSLPSVAYRSLYKSDPRGKTYYQQCDIDDELQKISSVTMKDYQDPVGLDIQLDLDSVPKPEVPKNRAQRKMEQLVNLTKATLQISRDSDTIVDFCSGSGHLGLILANCLPNCTVLLVDNKERSLNRAREKLSSLGLANVFVIQSNLDYFIASFQVGVSLHACGVASDLVIHKCMKNRANFVVCPCCYGNIQKNHIVEYPQSEEVQRAGVNCRGFVVLGHCADQAGTAQGERGMLAVDTDRCLAAEDRGYTVTLSKLVPPSCSVKNNLIVAYLPHASVSL